MVTKQSPNGTLVAASGLPITMIGNKRPLAAAGTSIPSVVPVITYQNGPQEQHQIQIQVLKHFSSSFLVLNVIHNKNLFVIIRNFFSFHCSLLDKGVANLANVLQPFRAKKHNVCFSHFYHI